MSGGDPAVSTAVPNHKVHHLRYLQSGGGMTWITVRVEFTGPITRSLGVWPDTVTCRIVEPELALLPTNRSSATMHIRIGQSDNYIDIKGWRIENVTEDEWGHTVDDGTVRPVVYRLTLRDARWQLTGDRGGILMDGLLNATGPDGQIIAASRRENSALVQQCLDAMPMTMSGTLPSATLDAYDPPGDIEWYGVHAPTELQRLLERTRHAFALNQDGTYSIVKLTDAHDALTGPDIPAEYKLPSAPQTMYPTSPQKVLISGAPTRKLIERKRTLTTPRPVQWVGVDTDGSIDLLANLSWWPSGKTALQVFNNAFNDVADDHQHLARASVFKMFRLHDDDLNEGWTLMRRLVNQYTFLTGNDQPHTCKLKAKIAVQDKHGMWLNSGQTGGVLIEDVDFDVETGVVRSRSRYLVKLTPTRAADLIGQASKLINDDLVFTFGHLPNAGDYTDYFMVPYEWDDVGEQVIEVTSGSPVPDALADPANVPVFRFDHMQLMEVERTDGTMLTDPVNLTELKAQALLYAGAIVMAQNAQSEVQQFQGLHDADPNGSVSQVVWDANAFITTAQVGHHMRSVSEYAAQAARSRQSRGGASGAPTTAQTRGMLVGRTGSAGAASGARAVTREAKSAAPGVGGGGSGMGAERRVVCRTFEAELISSSGAGANKWQYTVKEVYLKQTGFGSATKFGYPTSALQVTAGNKYEINNAATGMLGIGVTVAELTACSLQLKPVAKPWLTIEEHMIYKATGVVTYEYWFSEPNPVGGT